MAVPDFQSYMRPLLSALVGGMEKRITDISVELGAYFRLTQEELEEVIPSGKKTRHYDRVGWAATYLKQAGLLSTPRRGWYKITEKGLNLLQSDMAVNTDTLRQYPEFLDFQTRTRSANSDSVSTPLIVGNVSQTPDEILEAGYQELRNALALELIERLKEGSPKFFEQAVIDLLLAMGYGGSEREAAKRVGQSGDGGIDGIINEDKLGLDVIYIQAKRWQSSVGSSSIRDFSGSLDEKKATKGIFITTSEFTRDAKDYVSRIAKRIILIDGNELAQLMIDYNVGVVARKTYIVKRIDEDYFSEEL